MKKKGDCYLR